MRPRPQQQDGCGACGGRRCCPSVSPRAHSWCRWHRFISRGRRYNGVRAKLTLVSAEMPPGMEAVVPQIPNRTGIYPTVREAVIATGDVPQLVVATTMARQVQSMMTCKLPQPVRRSRNKCARSPSIRMPVGRVEVLSACLAKSRHRASRGYACGVPNMALTLMPPNLGCSPARKPRNNYKLETSSLCSLGREPMGRIGTCPKKVWMASKLIKLRCRQRNVSSPQVH